MNFALILVVSTLVSGLIWGWWHYTSRNQVGHRKEPLLVEYARSFFPVLLVVLVLRSFIIEPFRIPSSSMMPTLLVGDFILVSKFSYGIRLPVLNTRILPTGTPKHGDVMVFRYPEDTSIDYIKRVVGLPGDTVTYRNKVLSINGEVVAQEGLGQYIGHGSGMSMSGARVYREELTESGYEILVVAEAPSQDFTFNVPEGEYFVLGDNRDNSRDSRFWGAVPESHLVGRAFLVWMSWDSAGGGVNWSRIGSGIR